MRRLFLLAAEIVVVPDPTSIGWWLSNFGPIGLVMFCAVMGLWKLCIFVKPYFVALATGHVALMSALAKTQVDQTGMLHDVRQTQTDHGEKLDEIHRHVVPLRHDQK